MFAKERILLELLKVFINVAWDLYVYMLFLVIPLDGDCRLQFSFPIDFGFV